MDKNALKEIRQRLKSEKQTLLRFIDPYEKFHSTDANGRKKKKELIDLARFAIASGEKITVVSTEIEAPDFIIEWDGEQYGLEHVELIDSEKRDVFERTEKLIRNAEAKFLAKYGEINRQVNFSLNFEVQKTTLSNNKKLQKELKDRLSVSDEEARRFFRMGYPGLIANEEFEAVAEELADIAFRSYQDKNYQHPYRLVNRIFFLPISKTIFTRSGGYSVGAIDELLLKVLKNKEDKIESYKTHTNGLKQAVLLVIQGAKGFSDYSEFNDQVLANRNSTFDKVAVLNFFKQETFILK